jgi:hypothetical protein
MLRVGWVRISRRGRGLISRRRRGAELGVGLLGLSHYILHYAYSDMHLVLLSQGERC